MSHIARVGGTTGHLARESGTTGHLVRGVLEIIYNLTGYALWEAVYACSGSTSESNTDWNASTRTLTNVVYDGVHSLYPGRWAEVLVTVEYQYRIVVACHISEDLDSATLTITDEVITDTATAIATFTYSGDIALDEESGNIIGNLSLTSYSIDDAGVENGGEPITFDATSEEWESGAYVEPAQT